MKKGKKYGFLAAVVVGSLVIGWLDHRSEETSGRESGSFNGPGPLQFLDAPDFTLLDLQGKPIRLSDQQGDLVLLEFWATW